MNFCPLPTDEPVHGCADHAPDWLLPQAAVPVAAPTETVMNCPAPVGRLMSLTVTTVRSAFKVAFPRLDVTVAVAGIDQPDGTVSERELNDELPSFLKVNVNGPDDTVGVAGDTVSVYCFSAPKAAPNGNTSARTAADRNPRIVVRIVFIVV